MEHRPIRSVCWLRRDLRVADNTALWHALEDARERDGKCLVVFCFDTEILAALQDRDDRRVGFIAGSVAELHRTLAASGGGLRVLHGSARREIPGLVRSLGMPDLAVHCARDAEPAAIARDLDVTRGLSECGARLVSWNDQVVFGPEEVSMDGRPYRVYTPFRRAWGRRLDRDRATALGRFPSEAAIGRVAPVADPRDLAGLLAGIGFRDRGEGPRPGESGARSRLEAFLGKIQEYSRDRDLPGTDATSRLSVDLRFGTISVRELFRAGFAASGEGASKWIDELVWREFHQTLLARFPATVDRAFQPAMERVVWDDPAAGSVAESRWKAFQEGRTGFPFVEAALRELVATGWMHNRARMVVASFLTKDLHLHWKLGERWFARHLIDFDLAQNVGGWQWAASTGADGQPWFRIFHPATQSRTWDPSGDWIRRWCPELVELPAPWIHAPWDAPPETLAKAGVVLDGNYPKPVVDHARERMVALERFKSAANLSS